MQIVTICSHFPTQDYYCHRAFFESCNRFGFQPVNVGHNGKYGGLGSKPRLLKKAIENGEVRDSYIIFCDAWDVVFQQSPEKVMDYVQGEFIVFNAEKNCFPRADWADRFQAITEYKYLNSGFSFGPTELYLQALKEMKVDEIPDDKQNPDGSWNCPNDQEYWQKEFLEGKVPMGLDNMAQICQTLHGVEQDELNFSESLIRNNMTGTTPVAFHLNGQKEKWKPLILKHLDLPE